MSLDVKSKSIVIEARRLYSLQIMDAYYCVESHGFKLTRAEAIKQRELLLKKEQHRQSLRRIPIIKRFAKNNASQKESIKTYDFVLSLMDHIGSDELTIDMIEYIVKANKDGLYEKFYEENYQNIACEECSQ